MKTVLFQGDSITDAAREGDIFLGDGYATRVAGDVGLAYPNTYHFINRGCAGDRIVDLYLRIKKDMINLKPDVISILVGVNDVWHEFASGDGVDAEKFGKVYDLLIQELRQALPGVKIMILEPFVLWASATQEHWGDFYKEVRLRAEKSKALAEKYNLTYVPLQDAFDEATKVAANDYWLWDGVHPTQAGRELISREWIKAFRKMEKLD